MIRFKLIVYVMTNKSWNFDVMGKADSNTIGTIDCLESSILILMNTGVLECKFCFTDTTHPG